MPLPTCYKYKLYVIYIFSLFSEDCFFYPRSVSFSVKDLQYFNTFYIYKWKWFSQLWSALIWSLSCTQFMSLSSYNGYTLNLHLTCFQRGFIAQPLEHCTGIVEVMGSNPVWVFICNCLSYFITARITFTWQYSLSAVQSYDLHHIHVFVAMIGYVDFFTVFFCHYRVDSVEW